MTFINQIIFINHIIDDIYKPDNRWHLNTITVGFIPDILFLKMLEKESNNPYM